MFQSGSIARERLWGGGNHLKAFLANHWASLPKPPFQTVKRLDFPNFARNRPKTAILDEKIRFTNLTVSVN